MDQFIENRKDGQKGGSGDEGVSHETRELPRTVILEDRVRKGGGKKKKGIIIFLAILAVFFIVVAVANTDFKANNSPYIGVVYVEGAIQAANQDSWGRAMGYQHQWTLNKIDRLIEESGNKGMILYVNTPGGGVYESDELYLKIKEYKEATGNPVYVYMSSMAASGGYYISAPADKIIANRNTWTGSIGITIGTVFDISGFLERYGIKTHTITAGRNKAMGSMVDPMTKEQAQILQSLVEEAYDQFVDVVAQGRGIPEEQVRELADGRIYSAKQALALKLIDKIGTFDDVVKEIRRDNNLEDCDIVNLAYKPPSLWESVLSGDISWNGSVKALGAGSEAEAILSLIRQEGALPISYIYRWTAQ